MTLFNLGGKHISLGLLVFHPTNDKAAFYVRTGKLSQIHISPLVGK